MWEARCQLLWMPRDQPEPLLALFMTPGKWDQTPSWPLLAFLFHPASLCSWERKFSGFTKGVSFELTSGHPCAQMGVAVSRLAAKPD